MLRPAQQPELFVPIIREKEIPSIDEWKVKIA